jgi:hypothetical protein
MGYLKWGSTLTWLFASVLGVKAPGGRPGSELSGGVVRSLAVVKSLLTKHLTSATIGFSAKTAKTWVQSSAGAWLN